MEMPTGYDLLEHSHEFRMHMLRRLAAGFIDVLIVFIPIIFVIYLANLEPREIIAGGLSGFGWFIYSVFFESQKGTTPGKKVMNLIVVSTDGPMTFSKSIVRNVPKMFWYIFLPLDTLVGLAIMKDPRMRWVEQTSFTVVIKKNE